MIRFLTGDAQRSLLLVLVVVVVHVWSLRNGFTNDDFPLIVQNDAVKTLSSLPDAFVVSYYPGMSYYRPVGLVSYMVDHAVWGMRPAGFRLTNVVLHAAATVLVFWLFRRLLPQPNDLAALAGALIFAVHPAATSVVYPITAREAIWCTVFSVAAVLLLLRRTPKAYVGSLACFALALLSKETAVTLPFCLIVVDWCARLAGSGRAEPATWRRLIRRHVPFFAVLAGYMALRVAVLGPGLTIGSASPNAGDFFASWLYLAQMSFLPTVQLVYEPSFATWCSPAKVVLVAVVLVVIVLLGIRAAPLRRRYVLTWLAWSVLTFLPTANLMRQETRWDERYNYMPAIGLLGAVLSLAAGRFSGWAWRRRVAGGAVAVACVVLAAISVGRARYWHDNETFYRQWLSHAPDRTIPNYGLACVLEKRGLTYRAIEHYRRALQTEPDNQDARINLGIALAGLGRYGEAVEQFRTLLRYHPRSAKAYFNMGVAQEGLGQTQAARHAYEQAIALQPEHADARNNLGLLLGRSGDFDGAIEQFRLALEADARCLGAYSNLAVGLVAKGEYGEAIDTLRRGLQVAPDDMAITRNLARLLARCPDRRLRDGAEALRLAQRVCAAGPDDPSALEVLAAAYAEVGRFDDAVETIQRVIQRAESQQDVELAERLRAALVLYRAGSRYEGPP